MKQELYDYQQTMCDRYKKLGVHSASPEQFHAAGGSSTEVVKEAVMRYHQHCQQVGVYKGFSNKDVKPTGLEQSERAELVGHVQALSEIDPDRFIADETAVKGKSSVRSMRSMA
mmetsp:Transcript_63503/g.204650  ORF Transcript_63503/g.204650 Transcript_63503/m.204650 type:complete len:114 (-) Transcript_63503:65-406(-)